MSVFAKCVKITVGDKFYMFGGFFDPGAEETFCEAFCREFSPEATAEVLTVEMPHRQPYYFCWSDMVSK